MTDVRARFMARVEAVDGHWLWRGRPSRGGYCQIQVDGRLRMAHRVAHELFLGPIPEGYEVDHLCYVRECVNPEHLEAVTRDENRKRAAAHRRALGISVSRSPREYCRSMRHLMVPENIYNDVNPDGSPHRRCRACANERRARRRESLIESEQCDD